MLTVEYIEFKYGSGYFLVEVNLRTGKRSETYLTERDALTLHQECGLEIRR